MKKWLIFLLTLMITNAYGQENLEFQKPPKEILDLVDVPRAPSVLLSDDKEYMILLSRNSYKTIEELSQTELRLGGLRIDPKTNIGSRVTYVNNVQIRRLNKKESEVIQVSGLPANPKLANFGWSPDQSKIALTNTTPIGVELWILDLKKASVFKLSDANINANLGDVINWFEDGKSVLVKTISPNRKDLIDTKSAIPTGPTVSVNDGKKAQNRTYQDLLKNSADEFNFEQLASSELHKISMDGESMVWMADAMYDNVRFSPDGNYIMVTTVEKPFSYLVPYSRFPSKSIIYDKDGKSVKTVLESPLLEDLPQGFMSCEKGKRNFGWRSDKGASLIFCTALDQGDPEVQVDFRDEVFEWESPFTAEPKSLLKTINRYAGILWGKKDLAIAYDYWWNTRNTKTYAFDPSNSSKNPSILWDRNYQDIYNDPGDFVSERSDYGTSVMAMKGSKAFLTGAGHTEEGQFPFLSEYDFTKRQAKRLYTSELKEKKEGIVEYDPKQNEMLVRIESPVEYPNYYYRSVKGNELKQMTAFENPFKSIQDVQKEVIHYLREDGLELSGTLYLPMDYDKNKKEKMPMVMWAYPTEFKDKASAGQSAQNPNEFTYPYYGSMIYWVTRGYVVLDDASFPIVGEGENQPNDSFLPQLVANAKAAIDAVDELGYIDRNRVAVAGHSYGAFMVANLLSHSDLFAAGIARSGAYNRTLTPFGFQSEERNYWEAPEIYNSMSPFMNAEKMKYPLLLIHGEADNNSGTYPMQSERYFNALKGLGATARLVILPKESHGYSSIENILHLLWEQDQWLEIHVKNKGKEQASN